MATQGGYTAEKLAWRAERRGHDIETQTSKDTRSSAQRTRDRTGRGYITPPEPKPKSTPAPATSSRKR